MDQKGGGPGLIKDGDYRPLSRVITLVTMVTRSGEYRVTG